MRSRFAALGFEFHLSHGVFCESCGVDLFCISDVNYVPEPPKFQCPEIVFRMIIREGYFWIIAVMNLTYQME
jgi:hypothetical protein